MRTLDLTFIKGMLAKRETTKLEFKFNPNLFVNAPKPNDPLIKNLLEEHFAAQKQLANIAHTLKDAEDRMNKGWKLSIVGIVLLSLSVATVIAAAILLFGPGVLFTVSSATAGLMQVGATGSVVIAAVMAAFGIASVIRGKRQHNENQSLIQNHFKNLPSLIGPQNEAALLLVRNGAPLDYKDKEGNNVAMIALKKFLKESDEDKRLLLINLISQLAVAKPALLEEVNNAGEKVTKNDEIIDFAVQAGNYDLVKILIQLNPELMKPFFDLFETALDKNFDKIAAYLFDQAHKHYQDNLIKLECIESCLNYKKLRMAVYVARVLTAEEKKDTLDRLTTRSFYHGPERMQEFRTVLA